MARWRLLCVINVSSKWLKPYLSYQRGNSVEIYWSRDPQQSNPQLNNLFANNFNMMIIFLWWACSTSVKNSFSVCWFFTFSNYSESRLNIFLETFPVGDASLSGTLISLRQSTDWLIGGPEHPEVVLRGDRLSCRRARRRYATKSLTSTWPYPRSPPPRLHRWWRTIFDRIRPSSMTMLHPLGRPTRERSTSSPQRIIINY